MSGVWCVPGSLESTVVVNCMHRGGYSMSGTLYLIKNTGIVPARPMMDLSEDHVFWLCAGIRPCITTSTHICTYTWGLAHGCGRDIPSIGLATAHSLMNKVLTY
jgi:hypothetical protein